MPQNIAIDDLDPNSKDSIRTASFLTLVDSSQLLRYDEIILEGIAEKNALTLRYYNDRTVLENYIPKSSTRSDFIKNQRKNEKLVWELKGIKYTDQSNTKEYKNDIGNDKTDEELITIIKHGEQKKGIVNSAIISVIIVFTLIVGKFIIESALHF